MIRNETPSAFFAYLEQEGNKLRDYILNDLYQAWLKHTDEYISFGEVISKSFVWSAECGSTGYQRGIANTEELSVWPSFKLCL